MRREVTPPGQLRPEFAAPCSAVVTEAPAACPQASCVRYASDRYAPEALLTRKNAAQALSEMGFPLSSHTLSTMATRGGGPVFRKWGGRGRVLYLWSDLIEWARSRLSPPRASTSDCPRG